ncbi:unnamed protein product [Sphagnum balticum]
MEESPVKLKDLDGPVAGRSLESVKIGPMINYISAPPQLCIRSGEKETASTRSAAAVTFYGSAPPELWTELLPMDVQDISHEQNSIQGTDSSDLDQLLHIDPSELQIGQRPELHPAFVNEGMSSLLHMCWHPDPLQRPEWDQIKSRLHKLERHNSDQILSSDNFRLPNLEAIEICRTTQCARLSRRRPPVHID